MALTPHLANWSGAAIADECRQAYTAYRAAKTESYRAYFTGNPDLRAEDHEYKAKDLAAALPDDWAGLTDELPVSERHRHHLSGNSSQVLALGLLGVGKKRDPSLSWLWDALGPLPPLTGSQRPAAGFEHKLAPETLGEQPRQTSIDFYVDDPAALLCIECKWAEAGIGACGCGDGAVAVADCSDRVLDRKAYWATAYEVFHLPERQAGERCPLSFTYQAVRNVAAALALARPGQQPVFGLIYDADNPYFAGCGDWPGWSAALNATLNDVGAPVRFASVSWQELLPLLPLDAAAAAWASEKHGLHKSG
ncbi:MAG TPA: hypothetical protein VGO71_09645 [Baekduia sp.]|jgi:hypothetical protein|nr:hypothetical protein [Baekduia sp.]